MKINTFIYKPTEWMLIILCILYCSFGVVFVAPGDQKDEPTSNAGAALLRAFSFIKSDKDNKEAFNFLTKV